VIGIAILASWGSTFSAEKFSNLVIEDGDFKVHAYVAKPKVFESQEPELKKYPVAILFHAWNGLSEEVVYFADRLAGHGYYVIAPDLFRGVASKSTNSIWNIINSISTKQDRMNVDVDLTLNYILNLQPVNNQTIDSTKIMSGPGFCFGGTQSLILSNRWPTAGTVTLYGTYIQELADADDSKAWGKIGNPDSSAVDIYKSEVLGIYGDLDTRPGKKDAEKFETALNAKGINNTISMYKNVGHAFVNEVAHEKASAPGHEEAVKAWDEVVAFMKSSNGVSDFTDFKPVEPATKKNL